MEKPYLDVTFRNSRPIAAYLFLDRQPGDKTCRTSKIEPGLIIDYEENGRAIGIEITAPTKVTVSEINRILMDLGAPAITGADLAPLKAA